MNLLYCAQLVTLGLVLISQCYAIRVDNAKFIKHVQDEANETFRRLDLKKGASLKSIRDEISSHANRYDDEHKEIY
jgi:hypothetical protein